MLSSYWEDKSRPVPVFLVGTKKDLLRDEEVMKRASEDKSTIITLEEVGL